MQEMILILSRCQAQRMSPKTKKKFFRFHFKGFYNGQKIKEIYVYPRMGDAPFVKGEDYLLWVSLNTIEESVLKVVLIKYKRIE
jgi:hypothetical protein